MKLTAKSLGDLLETTLGYRVEMTPYGFELQNEEHARARIRCGSGIAGRSYVWGLVRLPDGGAIALGLDTKAKLVRAVLEFMAGRQPTAQPEYTIARAKRVIHPVTGASRFVWYRRLKRQPKTRVVLVPFGSSLR